MSRGCGVGLHVGLQGLAPPKRLAAGGAGVVSAADLMHAAEVASDGAALHGRVLAQGAAVDL